MNWLRGTKGTLLLAAVAMAGTTCTLLLDHNATQCKTDDDCNKLGTYPICNKGLCVPSGLQPAGCFPVKPGGTVPTTQHEFLNACSVNAMLAGSGDAVGSCLTFTTTPDDGAVLKTPQNPAVNPTTLPDPAPTLFCKDMVPAGKQILYLSGSSNFPPLLQELAQVIVNSINIVPVFRTTTSCTGVKSMNPMSTTFTADHTIEDPVGPKDPYPSYAQIFLGDLNPPQNCLLGTGGVTVDVGESGIAQDTCGPPVNPPESVGESLGPILPDHLCRSQALHPEGHLGRRCSTGLRRRGRRSAMGDAPVPVHSWPGHRDLAPRRQADRPAADPVLGDRPG